MAVEGKGVYEVAVGRAGAAGRVDQFSVEFAGPQVVDVESVAVSSGCEAGVFRDRHRVACMHSFEGFPLGGSRQHGSRRALASLFDPEFEKSQFIGVEVDGIRLVLGRRHELVLKVRGGKEHETLQGFSRNESGTAVSAGEHSLGRFQVEVRLGLLLVVAGKAVFAEEGNNLGGEIDRGVAFQFGHGKLLLGS